MGKGARLLLLAALAALAGCTTAETPQLPPFDSARYGMSGCPAKYRNECEALANKTFLSYGPAQVEYHTADGRTFIWVGNRIFRGYWSVIPGLFGGKLCYEYGSSASNCDGDLDKGTAGRDMRVGDIYGLADRAAPPFDLRNVAGGVNFDTLDRTYAERSRGSDG